MGTKDGRFPSFLKDGSSYWSAAPLTSLLTDIHHNIHNDIISFLCILQQHNVNILPILWQSGLQDLGSGAQSVVSQSIQNAQRSFAFKRSHGRSVPGDVFRVFSSEVRVLQQAPVRNHPNVLNLEGICWEVQSNSSAVSPVLVFEKARHGDLRSFMASESGRSLSVLQRVDLCIGIASAILTLHDRSMTGSILFSTLAKTARRHRPRRHKAGECTHFQQRSWTTYAKSCRLWVLMSWSQGNRHNQLAQDFSLGST